MAQRRAGHRVHGRVADGPVAHVAERTALHQASAVARSRSRPVLGRGRGVRLLSRPGACPRSDARRLRLCAGWGAAHRTWPRAANCGCPRQRRGPRPSARADEVRVGQMPDRTSLARGHLGRSAADLRPCCTRFRTTHLQRAQHAGPGMRCPPSRCNNHDAPPHRMHAGTDPARATPMNRESRVGAPRAGRKDTTRGVSPQPDALGRAAGTSSARPNIATDSRTSCAVASPRGSPA